MLCCLSTVILFVLGYFVIRAILEYFRIGKLNDKPVFITGCDSGFGHDLALKCLANGMPVFAGCLTQLGADSLSVLAKSLPGQLYTVIVDVSNDESVNKAKEYLEEKTKQYGGLHGVVNNAGIVGNSFRDDFLTIEDYKKCSEVNLWGVIRTTHAVKSMIKRKKGRIVTVASICGRVGLAGIGPYTVSKYGVEAYCDVIRQEMRPFGVSVHTLEPGFFKTPLINHSNIQISLTNIWDKCPSGVKEEYGKEFFLKDSERVHNMLDFIGSTNTQWVVDAYFHALTAVFPRTRYQIGYDCHFIFVPLSFLPSKIQDLLLELSMKVFNAPVPESLK